MTRPDDVDPDGEPTPDEAIPGEDDDELFAAVAAAMSRPPRRDSASFRPAESEATDTAASEAPEDAETGADAAEPDAAEAGVDAADEPEADEADAPAPAADDAEAHPGGAEAAVVEEHDEIEVDEAEPAGDAPHADDVVDDEEAGVDDEGADVEPATDATTVQPAVEDDPYAHLYAPAPTDGAGDDDGPTDWDDLDDDAGPRWGRRLVVGAVLLIGVAYLAGYFLTGLRMPADAAVSGVDVSGTSPSEARRIVAETLTPETEKPIVLTHEESEFTIDPAESGMSLNVDASVDAVGGTRSWDPRDMAALVFGTRHEDAVVDTEAEAFGAALASIAETIDIPVVQPQISFPDGEPEARQPEAGTVLDKAETTEVVKRAYVTDGGPEPVVMMTVEPDVDAEGLQAAMDGIAQTVISGPVDLEVGDKTVELPVSAYTPALVIRVEDGEMVPYIDAKTLAEPLLDSTTGIGEKAVDATVAFEGGKPVVVPGKPGVGLQPEEMATKLLPAIVETGDARTVSIEAKVVEPLFTTEDAENLGITERISSFTTEYPPATYRDVNQSNAANRINGTIIKPGETFSFNGVVGERTTANGFVSGTVINGGVFREELGGGVSQVATTMYNAAFFGGMDDVEHHPHAFWISRYPVGREATVYWGSLDLRWKNSTDYGVLIRSYVEKSGPGRNGKMTVELWSTKVWDIKAGQSAKRNFRNPGTRYDDTDRCVPQSPIQGFDIDIYRYFEKDGKRVKTETDTAVYQAADRVVCGPRPSDDDD